MVFDKKPGLEGFQEEIVRRINDNTRRTRMLEQATDVINLRIRGIEERVISDIESLKKNLDQLFYDIKDVSKNLDELKGEILKLNKNMDKVARKSEVKELESLMELYNPIKSKFITRDELERVLDDRISKR